MDLLVHYDSEDEIEIVSEKDYSFERVNPHIEGQWAFHVYIQVPYRDITPFITPRLSKETTTLVIHDEKPHISLSNNLSVPHHLVQSLLQKLRASIQAFPPLQLQIHSLRCLTSSSRTYFVQTAQDATGALRLLLEDIDSIVQSYGLPIYPGDLHVSRASIEGIQDFPAEISTTPPMTTSTWTESVSHITIAYGGKHIELISLEG